MQRRDRLRTRHSVLGWTVLGTAAAALWLAPARPAAACSCAPKPSPSEAKLRAGAVFEGRVYGVTAVGERTRYNFEVDRYWKGELPERIEVLSNSQSSACGRTFELGRPYLVYARVSAGTFHDTLCSRTRAVVAAAEDLAALGEASTPAVASAADAGAAAADAQPREPPRLPPVGEAPAPVAPSARGCAVGADGVGAYALGFLVALAGLRRRR